MPFDAAGGEEARNPHTCLPRVTFGLIVLNAEPFMRYNLRALYPFAHQIIVVEGAVPGAEAIASQEGHSTDDTLATLKDFQEREDPDGKVVVVTAEDEGYPNGFWPGEKHEQSQAYARRTTGDYLWQVDMDEFYQPEAMRQVLEMLAADPKITTVSFDTLYFWSSPGYRVDGWYVRHVGREYHRLFKWGLGYRYVTHRPPTVVNEIGVNLREKKWVRGKTLAHRNIFLYHYSLLFPKQVLDKAEYYARASWSERAASRQWVEESFLTLNRPFRIHNMYRHPSWLERFPGQHPPQVMAMWSDIAIGKLKTETRPMGDVDRLLVSNIYRMQRWVLKSMDCLYALAYPLWQRLMAAWRPKPEV